MLKFCNSFFSQILVLYPQYLIKQRLNSFKASFDNLKLLNQWLVLRKKTNRHHSAKQHAIHIPQVNTHATFPPLRRGAVPDSDDDVYNHDSHLFTTTKQLRDVANRGKFCSFSFFLFTTTLHRTVGSSRVLNFIQETHPPPLDFRGKHQPPTTHLTHTLTCAFFHAFLLPPPLSWGVASLSETGINHEAHYGYCYYYCLLWGSVRVCVCLCVGICERMCVWVKKRIKM